MTAQGLPGRAPVVEREDDGEKKGGQGENAGGMQMTTPTRSPEHDKEDSPNSDQARAAPAPLASPTVEVEVPTPRGVDQMSPDGNRSFKVYKDMDCMFCGHRTVFKGWLAFKTHVYSNCSGKPAHKKESELKTAMETYWADQPALDETEMVRALTADDADGDETDIESQDDDDGPRSGEARVRDADAKDNATSDSDEDHDEDGARNLRASLKSPETLFDDVSNAEGQRTSQGAALQGRKRRTAQRPQRYATSEDRAQEDDPDLALTGYYCQCGRTFATEVGLKIHRKRSSCGAPLVDTRGFAQETAQVHIGGNGAAQDASTKVSCEVCGQVCKSAHGLRTHQNRWCKGRRATNANTVPQGATVASAEGTMFTTRKARRCVVRETHNCSFVGKTFDELVEHMQTVHNVTLNIRVAAAQNAGNENEEPREFERSPEVVFKHIHHSSRTCTICGDKFRTVQDVIEHYSELHNVRCFTSASSMAQAQQTLDGSVANNRHAVTAQNESPRGRKSKMLRCPYCNVYEGKPGAGYASHERACKKKHGGARLQQVEHAISPAQRNTQPIDDSGAPTELEMDIGQRWCLHCPPDSFVAKNYRGLCTHYRKVHNIILVQPRTTSPLVEDVAITQTEIEEVAETDGDEDVASGAAIHAKHAKTIELMSDQTDCTECDYRSKTHKGLKTHMRMSHSMYVTSIAPPPRRRSSTKRRRDRSVTPAREHVALVPVKRITRESKDERAIVAVPTQEVATTVGTNEFRQLMDSFRELSEAHERLARSHEELSRSHEITVQANAQFEKRISILEKRSKELRVGRPSAVHSDVNVVSDEAATIERINPRRYDFSPITTFGRLIWLAGISASDEVDPRFPGQMRQALSNLVELLVEAGTDVLHLVDVTIYLADIRDLYEAAEVWNEFFTDLGIPREQRPVRNVLQSLVSKDKMLKVELYAQAVLPAEGETALQGGVPPRALTRS